MSSNRAYPSVAPIVQQPSGMPCHRYAPFKPVDLPDRTWPNKTIERAPRWLSTDLRDGNQALIDPMSPTRKRAMFDLLVSMGYKEIEVGFPGQPDRLRLRPRPIEADKIPADVRIWVLTQAREDLIERSVQSLAGAQRATVHLYNATAPTFRKVVFRIGRDECKQLAVAGTEHVMKFAEQYLSGTDFGYEYSPEIFMDTELDFALETCEAVMDVWQPEPGREIILNLPCTVERSTPNVYADQIEWMRMHLSRREHSASRSTPTTTAAPPSPTPSGGAGRGRPVEGWLFGNGERTGNVCLVTLDLNLSARASTRGSTSQHRRDPPHHEYVNQLQVPPRPRTRASSSHRVLRLAPGRDQEGLGPRRRSRRGRGRVRRLPVERPLPPHRPARVGRSYAAVIRINSRSGKGGVAYVMKTGTGSTCPAACRSRYPGHPGPHRREGGEVTPTEIWDAFSASTWPAGRWRCSAQPS